MLGDKNQKEEMIANRTFASFLADNECLHIRQILFLSLTRQFTIE